jgi:hypothetical protein
VWLLDTERITQSAALLRILVVSKRKCPAAWGCFTVKQGRTLLTNSRPVLTSSRAALFCAILRC